MKKLLIVWLRVCNLFWHLTGLEPSLYNADRTVNVQWIKWWCQLHGTSFDQGQLAWEIEAAQFEEPDFNDPAWFVWAGKQNNDATLEELEAYRKMLLVKKRSCKMKEPCLLIGTYLLDSDWLYWYCAVNCAGLARGLLAAKKKSVSMGVVPKSMLNEGYRIDNI